MSRGREAFDSSPSGRMHDGAVNHHVVVNEFGGPCAIRKNSANGASDQQDITRSIDVEPLADITLVSQVKLIAGCGEDVCEPLPLKMLDDRSTDEASMASNVDRATPINRLVGLSA